MSQGPASSIREWLEGLGLPQYAERFEEQAIDLDMLPDLNEDHLAQLGVAAMGHRLKLIRAAAALRLAAHPQAPRVDPPVPAGAERRQLTVMFCDLVGSTALSHRLDPEDMHALIGRYRRAVAAVIDKSGGVVAQYLGDGLLAYFGWPHAHENAAHRAVLAALEVTEVAATIEADERLAVRIGIATGPVVVGQGGAETGPHTAVGETPNLAARVQGLAQPGEVLIAGSTRRLLGSAFVCEELGAHTLKGIDTPVTLWRVHGDADWEHTVPASTDVGPTQMINRELEIALLLERWALAGRGEGQAVLIVGEAGIGKSRLIEELCRRVPAQHLLLRLQCSELHVNSAFHPLLQALSRGAGITRGDPDSVRLAKLEGLLQRLGQPTADRLPYFASLLSLPLTRFPEQARSSPAKLRAEAIQALVRSVLDAARERPVLMVAEDLHWMDPSTLEVIESLVAALRSGSVMLVMTSREVGSRWIGLPHLTSLTITGLSRAHSLQLAQAVASANGLPPGTLERIVDRTDGVPFFVQELTRSLAEGCAVRRPGDADGDEIPLTLKDSLAARLDRTGPARRVAQLGAVLGRTFRHDVLGALAGIEPELLQSHLKRLRGAGLLSCQGAGDDAVYTFQHALIQDAAYESLLKSDRRQMHARAAEILAERQPELRETEPEVLARHHTAGEVWDQAVPLWLKAGQRAWARSAVREAIAQLEAGLAVVGSIGNQQLRDSLELALQATRGVVYFAAVSYAAPQAQAAFARASELCGRSPDPAAQVPVLYGIGTFQTMRGNVRDGHATFERLAQRAEESGQPRLRLIAHTLLAWSNFSLGRFQASIDQARHAVELYDSGALSGGPRLTAADPRVISESFRAQSLWTLGLVEEARRVSDAVLAHARALGDGYSFVYALAFASLQVPDLCGEREIVVQRAEEGARLARELGYPMLLLNAEAWSAWNRDDLDPQQALAQIDSVLERLDGMGVAYMHTRILAQRARLQLAAGQPREAQLSVARAVGLVEGSGASMWAVDVALAEAEVMLAQGGEQRTLARSALQLAVDVATSQQSPSWLQRAAAALARMSVEDPEPAPVRLLLEPFPGGSKEDADAKGLNAAQARLAVPGGTG